LPVEMSFTEVQKDKRVHDAGRNVFYRGLKGQKGARCWLKCLLQRRKKTKACPSHVEMSFTEVQKDNGFASFCLSSCL
ncbi:hypothetical protein P9682_10355, partial [Weizmannia sp. CD-2023]|nr:hypothetical protein [Weizmannia sp. CD-2023]